MADTVQVTTDYHVPQFDGDGESCDSKNCAAATGAMDVYAATRERMTSDQFRKESGVSCVPKVHTPSGGLRFSDVERVCKAHGVEIDFGWVEGKGYTRWSSSTLALRLEEGWSAHLAIDYGYLRAPWRAPGTSFTGDHSVRAHDYDRRSGTYCWHDPLRKTGIRIPADELVRAWWNGALRGYAGFVKEKVEVIADKGGTTDVAIRYAPKITSASRMRLPQGQKLYDAPGGNPATKMSKAGSPLVLGLTKSPSGRAWRPVVVTTKWSYADGKARRTVLYVPAAAGKVVPA
jgi:hypothetical protein